MKLGFKDWIQLILIFLFIGSVSVASAQSNTFPSDGNVGIGTLNPSEKLDVYGNIKLNNSSIRSFRSNGEILNYYGYGTEHRFWAKNSSGNYVPASLEVYDGSEYNTVLHVGNMSQLDAKFNSVGIGTANPTSGLRVAADGDNLFRIADDLNGNSLQIGTDNQLLDFIRIRPQSGDGLAITNNGDKIGVFVHSGSGNVGIGATNPDEKFHVNGSSLIESESPSLTVQDVGDRGHSRLYLRRGSESKDRAQVVFGNYDGTNLWHIGLAYRCGKQEDRFHISTRNYLDDCSENYTPEFTMKKKMEKLGLV